MSAKYPTIHTTSPYNKELSGSKCQLVLTSKNFVVVYLEQSPHFVVVVVVSMSLTCSVQASCNAECPTLEVFLIVFS